MLKIKMPYKDKQKEKVKTGWGKYREKYNKIMNKDKIKPKKEAMEREQLKEISNNKI